MSSNFDIFNKGVNNPVSSPIFSSYGMPQGNMYPPMPMAQEADDAFKLYRWFKDSGLTPEELDALATMKKNKTDIGKMLGIKKPQDDIEKLSDEMRCFVKDTDDKITALTRLVEKSLAANKKQ